MTNNQDTNITVNIEIGNPSELSERTRAALDELALAITEGELLDDSAEVQGFGFGTKEGLGDITGDAFSKNQPMGICISKTSDGKGGGHCGINTDDGPLSCTVDVRW